MAPTKDSSVEFKNGWAPQCKLLGREIPGEPFPRVNEINALGTKIANEQVEFYSQAGRLLVTRIVPVY